MGVFDGKCREITFMIPISPLGAIDNRQVVERSGTPADMRTIKIPMSPVGAVDYW